MKHLKSVLAIVLAVVLLTGSALLSVFANDGGELRLKEADPSFDPRLPELFVKEEEPEEPPYAPDEVVRVAIVLEDAPAIDQGYPIATIGNDPEAAEYQEDLCDEQEKVIRRIEKKVLDGEELDVAANLTLVANVVSADVEYGKIEKIEAVKGVKEVEIERVYEPLEDEEAAERNATALEKVLTSYTGAGAKVAILDSGVNDAHQAFNADALNYALRQEAPDTDNSGAVDDKELAAYKEGLHMMTQADVGDIIDTGLLHVEPQYLTAKQLYINDKIPFAYNYNDRNLSVQNGSAGIHGSHVAGIAAANTYIPAGDGETFVKADAPAQVVGTAPDAQILNLKVFGNNLCTDSVIATAVEDAIVLGADVLNLSLGTAETGFSCASSVFKDMFDKLSDQGVLVMGAVGNDGAWIADNDKYNRAGRPSKLYADDVNNSTTTPPSSYANLMGVAWSDGNGAGGTHPTINKSSAYGIPSSLMLQPEITANGTLVNSVDGNTGSGYTALSGTSMAAPDVAGAVAVVSQYLRTVQAGFENDTFFNRALSQNPKLTGGMITGGLLMSTADPMMDPEGRYYSLLRQGAGLLNVNRAVSAKSFIEVAGQPRGCVKAEVGDSPDGSNTFDYTFTLHNVSDISRNYVFQTNLFTEDIVTEGEIDYLADFTRELLGTTTYTIGKKTLEFHSDFDADVNIDGKTDARDAMAILDCLSGKREEKGLQLSAGDVNGDGKTTTYDAHLILKDLKTSAVMVAANDSVTVDVQIAVTDDLQKYPKGTYLEGFTSVIPVDMGEPDADVTHTIPILGFCGNWSDPDMFDRNTYIESFNGLNNTVPYTQNPASVYEINYMTYQDEKGNILRQTVNPFDNKVKVPMDKMALRPEDTIRDFRISLIRPAGAMCFAIMKRDAAGKRTVQYIDSVYNHQPCAFPQRDTTGGWSRPNATISVRTKLSKMLKGTDVQEGDTIELGIVAVPEYYEKTPGQSIGKARMTELIEDGMLGEGAYLTTKVTLDNTAPEIKTGHILPNEKKFEITATDDQSVAYVALFSGNGSMAYEQYVPDETSTGQSITHAFSSSKLQSGAMYYLVVGDYAGNTRTYRFTWGEKTDLSDKAIAYVRSYQNGGAIINRGDWVALRPRSVASNSTQYYNIVAFTSMEDSNILAGADAADNYLWQAFEDGRLYAAPMEDIHAKKMICDLTAAGMQTVRDLAFNPDDQMLYATDGTDVLWKIDPMRGEVKAVQRVTAEEKPAALYGLAINNDGQAFATSYDETSGKSVLLNWQTASNVAGEILSVSAKSCALKYKTTDITAKYISINWANDTRDTLYAACAADLDQTSMNNYLYEISEMNFDQGTCRFLRANEGFDYTGSLLYSAVRGLVYLPAMPELGLMDPTAPAPTGMNVLGIKNEMMSGDATQLSVVPVPWNAEFDPSKAEWQSENAGIVSVDENGLLTAVKVGTAAISVSYPAAGGEPLTVTKTITVTAAPSIEVAALIREGSGAYYWESFNTATPQNRKRLSYPQREYNVGTLNHAGDCLYLFGSYWAYRVNPKDFTEDSLEASITTYDSHADAAPGRTAGYYTDFGYLTILNDRIHLLGANLQGSRKGFETVSVSMDIAFANIAGNMGAMAYKEYQANFQAPGFENATKGADVYYMLNESGDLYEMYCYLEPYYNEIVDETYEREQSKTVLLGKVQGVSLPGVSRMQGEASASMIYDEATGNLVLLSKISNGIAKVQVIDPKTHSLVMTRELEDDVRQVGILYQYDYESYPDLAASTANSAAHLLPYAAEGAAVGTVEVNEEEKTITYELTADSTTNGLTSFSYDKDVLTFKNLTASMPYHSFHHDAENGTIKIAFADAEAVAQPTMRLTFTYEPKEAEQRTELTVTETEKGNPAEQTAPEERKEPVTLPGKPVERKLESIEISHMPAKTEYIEGQALNTTGLIVSAVYSDGSKEPLSETDYTITGYDATPGKQTVTVTYQELTAEFEVTVKEKTLTGIEITTVPDKLVYLEAAEELDVSGGKLKLFYNNGTTEEIDLSDDMITGGFDNTKPGKQTVTMSYGDYTATFEVTVQAKTVDHIEISKKPDKTEYVEGTTFDPKGMEVTVYYNNGQKEVITKDWVLDYDFNTPGQKEVKVTYGGKSTTLPVTVTEKTLTSIEITTPPDKLVYLEAAEELDVRGGKLRLTYNNGTTEEIDLIDEMITGGFDNTKPGKQMVTVTYGTFTTTFEVTVQAKAIDRIEISKKPDKLVYLEVAEELDVSGGKLKLFYNNGTTEEIDLTDDMITGGFDNTKPGKQTVTVTYGTFTATFEVTVQAKAIDHIEISKKPDKTEYVEGTTFDPKGMEVTVYYNNGKQEVLIEGWEIAYAFDKIGASDVTVSYQGHNTVLSVNVTAKTLTRIEVTQMPENTIYKKNDEFDGTGMELTLYFDNGTTETVTAGWTLDYDFSISGEREVKVSYNNMETIFTVTVEAAPKPSENPTAEPSEEPTPTPQPGEPGSTDKPGEEPTPTPQPGEPSPTDKPGEEPTPMPHPDEQRPTNKPVQTLQPENPGESKDEGNARSPKTGYENSWYLWAVLMLSSGSVLALFVRRKKQKFSD